MVRFYHERGIYRLQSVGIVHSVFICEARRREQSAHAIPGAAAREARPQASRLGYTAPGYRILLTFHVFTFIIFFISVKYSNYKTKIVGLG